MVVSKTSDYIQIMITMSNPSQESPPSYKAPNEDSKEMDVLCTFKIKIEKLKTRQLKEAYAEAAAILKSNTND